MRRLVVGIIMLLLLIMPFCAYASEPSDASTSAKNQDVQSIENKSEDDTAFSEIKDLLQSIPTLIELLPIIAGLVFWGINKREPPWYIVLLLPTLFTVLITIIRIAILFEEADFIVTVVMIAFFTLCAVLFCKWMPKVGKAKNDTQKSTTDTVKRINDFASRTLKNCHPSIKGVQFFLAEKLTDENDGKTIYKLKLKGGDAKEKTNINTLFSGYIEIPEDLVEMVKRVKQLIERQYEESEIVVLKPLVGEVINKLKQDLNSINSIDAIRPEDCYKARVLLIVLSIWVSKDKPFTPYVGLEESSLELQNKDVENCLFTFARSGVLGPLLIDDSPYIFTYRRQTHKKGRFYYTFSVPCSDSEKYVVFITLEERNHKVQLGKNLYDNLQAIQEKCKKELPITDKRTTRKQEI